MEKRANELLSGLERSNKKLYTALNKLKRNRKAGKSETRLKSDASRVKLRKIDIEEMFVNMQKRLLKRILL